MTDRASALGVGSLLIAALAVGLRLPMGRPSESNTVRTIQESGRKSDSASALVLAPVSGFDLLNNFFGTSQLDSLPCVQTSDTTRAASCYDLDVIIVSVPDPIDSPLDWAFDADIESVRRAFEGAGYVTDRFWLPWPEDRRLTRAKTISWIRWQYPGVILFRASDPSQHKLRLAYLVGETAAGVHKPSLLQALSERDSLLHLAVFGNDTTRANTIRFVGPFFTGAALSVRIALDGWVASLGARRPKFASFISGSATGTSNLQVFASTRSFGRPSGIEMRFRATVNSDSTLNRVMVSVLRDSMGVPPSQIAVLRESSTQYGQQSRDTSAKKTGHGSALDSLLEISFPMSISSLRAEYARHPASSTSQQFEGTSMPRVPIQLQDSVATLDTPAPTSQLTPAALDLVLSDIASTLVSRNVRFIGLVGTDIRDKLFLGDELRKRVPDARLFTFGSHRLFLRPEYNNSLRGMLVFSTYPLFLENQRWTSTVYPQRPGLSFISDDAEGIYNATLMQLERADAAYEYTSPFDSSYRQPPTWVTQLGRHGFLPLAVVHDPSAQHFLEGLTRSDTSKASHWTIVRPWRRTNWLLIFAVVCAMTIACAIVVQSDLHLRRHTRMESAPIPKFASIPASSAVHRTGEVNDLDNEADFTRLYRRYTAQRGVMMFQREVFTLIRHLALITMFALLSSVLPREVGLRGSELWLQILFFIEIALGLTAVGCFVARTRNVWRHYRPKWTAYYGQLRDTEATEGNPLARTERALWQSEMGATVAIALLAAVFSWMCARFIIDMTTMDYARRALTLFRAQHLDSGTSPILPMVLIATALVLWCNWHIERIALVDDTTPFEEALLHRGDRRLQNALERTRRKLAQEIRDTRRRLTCIVPMAASRFYGVVGTVMVLLLAGGVFLHFERSPEVFLFGKNAFIETRFDAIVRLGVIAAFGATIWTLWRFLAVWRSLREVLKRVAAGPLVTAFERLPRRISRLTRLSVFSDPSRSVVEAVSYTQWVHLKRMVQGNEAAFQAVDLDAFGELQTLLNSQSPLEGKRHRKPFKTSTAELRRIFALLEIYWEREPRPADVESVIKALKDSKDSAGTSTSGRIRRDFPDAVRLWVRTAEEFAAVQVVAYITWVFRCLRRIVRLLLYLLVVLTLIFMSQSFSPETVIKPAFLVLFLATILVLLYSLTQMNTDELLSRIQRTDPGRVTWDSTYAVNIGLVVAVPIIGLLSAYAPWFQNGAFGWIDPIVRVMTNR